jgi:excisionase family DNA binding protein
MTLPIMKYEYAEMLREDGIEPRREQVRHEEERALQIAPSHAIYASPWPRPKPPPFNPLSLLSEEGVEMVVEWHRKNRKVSARALVDEKEWLTVGEAAKVFGCGKQTIEKTIENDGFAPGSIRDLNPNGKNRQYRIHRSALGKPEDLNEPNQIVLAKPRAVRINHKSKSAVSDFSAYLAERKRTHGKA